ncbi:hypothetical protein EDD11_001541 [Mortierella claussenii]|nr:hypothetical protein EDD11_001541 [Mortierella claussenii]
MLRDPGYSKTTASIVAPVGQEDLTRSLYNSNNHNNNSHTNTSRSNNNPPAMVLPSELARKRQIRKDDAIRKKLDQELGKKRASTGTHRSTKPVQGSVGSLKADAVLVIDNDSTLVGIMTDKDLAFRVVAEGLDVRTTLVSQVMTRDPFCVTTDTNATEALDKMVNGGFRHLPCLNTDGDVVGLLDITKCMYEALEKLEKAHKSSKQLAEALEGMQSEWAQAANPELRSYVDIMREKMAAPDLNSIIEGNHGVAEIMAKTSVREASRVMKQIHATASLIMEDGRIAGIFTTKDIVVRVLAAGLVPDRTSVIRVMTPHPDTVQLNMTILDALKKMHDKHYLHLPVVDELGHMAGLVDVLQISLSMLRQMSTIQGDNSTCSSEGPIWNRFWESSFQGDGTGSEVSTSDMRSCMMPWSEVNTPMPHSYGGADGGDTSMVGSSICVGTVASCGDSISGGRASTDEAENMLPSSTDFSPMPSVVDKMVSEFIFKFRDPNGQMHRLGSSSNSFKELYDRVTGKLGGTSEPVTLSYCDEENDQVLISQDSDVADAVDMAYRHQWALIRLTVTTPSSLAAAATQAQVQSQAAVQTQASPGESSNVTTIDTVGDHPLPASQSTIVNGMDAKNGSVSISMIGRTKTGVGSISSILKEMAVGSTLEGLDSTLVAGGVGLGLGMGIALIIALMRK